MFSPARVISRLWGGAYGGPTCRPRPEAGVPCTSQPSRTERVCEPRSYTERACAAEQVVQRPAVQPGARLSTPMQNRAYAAVGDTAPCYQYPPGQTPSTLSQNRTYAVARRTPPCRKFPPGLTPSTLSQNRTCAAARATPPAASSRQGCLHQHLPRTEHTRRQGCFPQPPVPLRAPGQTRRESVGRTVVGVAQVRPQAATRRGRLDQSGTPPQTHPPEGLVTSGGTDYPTVISYFSGSPR